MLEFTKFKNRFRNQIHIRSFIALSLLKDFLEKFGSFKSNFSVFDLRLNFENTLSWTSLLLLETILELNNFWNEQSIYVIFLITISIDNIYGDGVPTSNNINLFPSFSIKMISCQWYGVLSFFKTSFSLTTCKLNRIFVHSPAVSLDSTNSDKFDPNFIRVKFLPYF